MIRTSLLALLMAGMASGAAAQDPHLGHTAAPGADPHAGHGTIPQPPAVDPHAGHDMEMPVAPADPHAGHHMAPPAAAALPPAAASPDPHAGHTMAQSPAADPHAGHDMGMPVAPADPHAGHAMTHGVGEATGAQLPVGDAPAPPVITDSLADRVFGTPAMDRARGVLEDEHGGARVFKLQADELEWAPRDDRYAWEVEGRWGGDIHRLAFKTAGEGDEGDGLEAAEVQILYSRAVSRYTDVQVGLRYDIEPRSRTYAAVAVDTLAPYWFEAEAALFLSEDGDLLARLEGSYDFRLTQRLILQPRAELQFAAQDMPDVEIGSGLSSGELGLRLRYEVRREFAPYIGLNLERRFGNSADFARAAGEDVDKASVVIGVSVWF